MSDTIFLKRMDWLREYSNTNDGECFDILNSNFVDCFIEKFNPTYMVQPFGANSCKTLNRFLSQAYKRGYLTRNTIGLPEMEVGFPKWVYSYKIKDGKK